MSSFSDEDADNNIVEENLQNDEDGTNCSSENEEDNVSGADDTVVDLTRDSTTVSEDEEDEEKMENSQENINFDLEQKEQYIADILKDWESDSTTVSEDVAESEPESEFEDDKEAVVYLTGDTTSESKDEGNEEENLISISTIPNDLQLLEHEIVSLADFKKLKVLGKGGYGEVLLVQKLNGFDIGKLYAMKIIAKIETLKDKQKTEFAKSERIILEKITDLPFLIKLHYSFQTDKYLYLILDYIGGGDLFTQFNRHKKFTEEQIKLYIAELILAIEQLHERNIIYRDVKLENILLDKDGHIVLTDFGLSKLLPHSGALTTGFCGTVEYVAPEVCNYQKYGVNIDWWSIGALFVEFHRGRPPFLRKNEGSLPKRVLTYRITNKKPKIGKSMQGAARNFANQLLIKDATKRLGYRKGASELKEHPFLRDINWDDVRKKTTKPSLIPQITSETDVQNFSVEYTQMSTEEKNIEVPQNVDKFFRGFEYVNPDNLKSMRRRPSAYDLQDNENIAMNEELHGEENIEVKNDDEMAEDEQEEVDDEEDAFNMSNRNKKRHNSKLYKQPAKQLRKLK